MQRMVSGVAATIFPPNETGSPCTKEDDHRCTGDRPQEKKSNSISIIALENSNVKRTYDVGSAMAFLENELEAAQKDLELATLKRQLAQNRINNIQKKMEYHGVNRSTIDKAIAAGM